MDANLHVRGGNVFVDSEGAVVVLDANSVSETKSWARKMTMTFTASMIGMLIALPMSTSL